jgi:hypothetical protein
MSASPGSGKSHELFSFTEKHFYFLSAALTDSVIIGFSKLIRVVQILLVEMPVDYPAWRPRTLRFKSTFSANWFAAYVFDLSVTFVGSAPS